MAPVRGHNRIVRIPALNDRFDRGVYLDEVLQRFPASHSAWNGEIHDHRIKRLSSLHCLPVQLNRLVAVFSKCRSVTVSSESVSCGLPDALVVIHDQDRAGA